MNTLTERLFINTYSHGLGERKGKGKGEIGLMKLPDGNGIEISVGQGRTKSYSGGYKASQWVRMTPKEAHEFAAAVMYLSGGPNNCPGDGLKPGTHKTNLSVTVSFETDLCTVLNKREDLKKEIMAKVGTKLDEIQILRAEEKTNVSV